jgi:UDPglucose--hexose-1-phosphate uridylyltransferase
MNRIPSIRRWNPILGEWVIIAPNTAGRPWSGALVDPHAPDIPEFDPSCYLCPGVARAGGAVNPLYRGVYVFDNDFPTFSFQHAPEEAALPRYHEVPARGICRVVCFSPRHNTTLPEMGEEEVYAVVRAFRDQYEELSSIPEIASVMMFENRGMAIGVSNPHPHGQIYATDFVPRIPAARYGNARHYFDEHDACLFCGILEEELSDGARIVTSNERFAAFVPPFARHAFEIMLLPRRHTPSIIDMTDDDLRALASIYREVLIRCDNLYSLPFPNITIFQNPPCAPGTDREPFHFHIEFLPPMRSRDKLKYMAGFESGGGTIINPAHPDDSARALRETPVVHYKMRNP